MKTRSLVLAAALATFASFPIACSSGKGGGMLPSAGAAGSGGSAGFASGGTSGNGAGGSAGAGAGAGAGGSGGTPACTPIGFTPGPSAFGVPAPRCDERFDAPAKSGYESIAYALFDFTGDQVSDLVVQRDDCDATVGTQRWDMYPGSPAGFALAPSSLTIPAPRCQEPFDASAKTEYDNVAYALLDLSGDELPDLVVHADDCDASVGQQRWDVYFGSASGFPPAPAAFTLPAPRCQQPFDALATSSYDSIGYALLDVTGDQLPDLVVYRDDCDAAVGSSRWDVHVGSPSGFAAAPTAFTLPAARCQQPFDALATGSYSAVGYALLDLTGDQKLDLVVHRDDCDAAVGTSRWDVYAGSPAGFAPAPQAFAVPAPRCQSSFDALADSSSSIRYALFDLTADAFPDLVVHRDDCDDAIGSQRWDVYAGSAAGFVATPSAFKLPAQRCQVSFDALAKSSGVGYGLLELSPASLVELTVHRDDCDGEVGLSRWDVYPTTCEQ